MPSRSLLGSLRKFLLFSSSSIFSILIQGKELYKDPAAFMFNLHSFCSPLSLSPFAPLSGHIFYLFLSSDSLLTILIRLELGYNLE